MNDVVKPKKKHVPQPDALGLSDIIVDKVVALFGTWQMLVLHIIWFGTWMVLGLEIQELTFWVSLEAILLSLLILISQQRQTDFDRIRAWTDLEIDRMAEKQTRILMEMVKEVGKKEGIKEFQVEKNPIKENA